MSITRFCIKKYDWSSRYKEGTGYCIDIPESLKGRSFVANNTCYPRWNLRLSCHLQLSERFAAWAMTCNACLAFCQVQQMLWNRDCHVLLLFCKHGPGVAKLALKGRHAQRGVPEGVMGVLYLAQMLHSWWRVGKNWKMNLREWSKSWLNLSVWLLDSGWDPKERLATTPRRQKKAFQKYLVNCGLWSETTFIEKPCTAGGAQASTWSCMPDGR